MMLVQAERIAACAWCGGRCHRASSGAHWRVEWRLGAGRFQGAELAGALRECEAGARAPLSALPGSSWALVEVRPHGEIAWLRFDDRELAKTRLALLQEIAKLLRSSSTPRCAKAWRAFLFQQRRELSRPQPDALMSVLQTLDGVLELHRLALLDVASGDSLVASARQAEYAAQAERTIERLLVVVAERASKEARALVEAWELLAPELAGEFRALLLTVPTVLSSPVVRRRPRRHVQEFVVAAPANPSGLMRDSPQPQIALRATTVGVRSCRW